MSRSGGRLRHSPFVALNRYSDRRASAGEVELTRSAGISDAANADNPSVTTATNVATGL